MDFLLLLWIAVQLVKAIAGLALVNLGFAIYRELQEDAD